jgi:ComF family protein
MIRLFASFFYLLINIVIPMREREARVAALIPEDLGMIKHGGGLPYHDLRVTALVWELKYKANPKALKIAGDFLSEELLGIAAEEIGTPLLIPVPMHPSRRKARGHNQTELLCEAALKQGAKGAYEYAKDVLVRERNTIPQQTLARAKRLKNVKNSMRVVDEDRIAGRTCVVLDDVSTTGATLAEAARALKQAGARKVHALALARS